MVTTLQIKPAVHLQPFVSCYSMRIFDTGDFRMPRPLHAVNEYFMSFFLGEQLCEWESENGILSSRSNSLTTLFTRTNGCSYWKGNYKIFFVQCKSNGLFAIFGIPQIELINSVLPLDNFLGNDGNLLTEQLAGCEDIYRMGEIMNLYLTNKLAVHKHKTHTMTIAGLTNKLLSHKGQMSLDKLCSYSNMSFRNFERRFTEEVGMPPKLFSRITRYYYAVESKMLHPERSWTEIAYLNGYYDQAHFIKESRMFSDKSPEELFNTTPPPDEKFIDLDGSK